MSQNSSDWSSVVEPYEVFHKHLMEAVDAELSEPPNSGTPPAFTAGTKATGRIYLPDRDEMSAKPVPSVTIPREVKTEIENLRRLVQTIQDRLHVLARM